MEESFKTRLNNYLDAAYAFLAVETHEESRVIQEIRDVTAQRTYTVEKGKEKKPVDYYEWDSRSGVIKLDLVGKAAPAGLADSQDPAKAFPAIAKFSNPSVVVMKDMHPFIEKEPVTRWMRNIAGGLRETGVTIIFTSPRIKIPVELEKEFQVVEYLLPRQDELATAFQNYFNVSIAPSTRHKNVKMTDEIVSSVSEASLGLTAAEADNAFALATVASGRRNNGVLKFDKDFLKDVFQEKVFKLKGSSLEYKPTHAGFDSVGGLDIVKAWALRRRQGFTEEARKLRIPYPKGALLAGIKGCGKTTVAQAIAFQFGFPLYVLDFGKLFGSKVGESEALTREVIRLMESIGPSVILIEEMEKALGTNSTSGGGDSGTSSRMFGTFLSWLSMKTTPNFLIGTLNNFEILPSELIRKGRFDEVFWVDLPQDVERVAIFNALLKHKYKVSDFEVTEDSPLIEGTQDFSGAEIDAAIEDALYGLLGSPKASMEKLLLEAVESINPQAKLDAAKVTALREKAQAFKPASSRPNKLVAPESGGRRRRVQVQQA